MQRNAEGGTVMGVSEALTEQVVFNKSKITSVDWVTFPILRMRDMPDIKVVVHEQPERRCVRRGGRRPERVRPGRDRQSVFDATGKQPRKLPLLPKYMKNLLAT